MNYSLRMLGFFRAGLLPILLLSVAFPFAVSANDDELSEPEGETETPPWEILPPGQFANADHEKLYQTLEGEIRKLNFAKQVKFESLGKGYLKALDKFAAKGDVSALEEATRFRKESTAPEAAPDVEPSSGVTKMMGVLKSENRKLGKAHLAKVTVALSSYQKRLGSLALKLTDADNLDAAKIAADELSNVIEPKIAQAVKLKAESSQRELATTDAGKNRKIPTSAKEFRGHHYKLYRSGIGFDAAQERCEALGGHLVVIDSASESEFVNKLGSDLGRRDGLWIGLSRTTGDKDDWRWVDGSRVDPSNEMFLEKRRRTDRDAEGTDEYSDGIDYMMLYLSGTTAKLHWLVHYAESGERTVTGYICEWDPAK